MSCRNGFSKMSALLLGIMEIAMAGDAPWDERLAGACSGRLKEIQNELPGLTPALAGLPEIPIDDQGGTGGYAGVYSSAVPAKGSSCAVEVRWKTAATIDLVALVPARRYDATGLDAQYG